MNWRLAAAITGHEAKSVQKIGWTGLKNGELLAWAEKEFDIFLTGDQNLSFQQHTRKYDIGIIVLKTKGTKLQDILPLVPCLLDTLKNIKPGQVEFIFHAR